MGAPGIKRKFSNFNTSCREMWRRLYSNETIAEEWVRDHLGNAFWTKRSSVEKWDSKVSDMEKHYEYGETFEISLQYEITWGSAVRYAEITSEEFMAMAWIARDKAYLAKASLLKIKHKAQWVKEKKEFDDELSEHVKNEKPERNVMFFD